MCTCTKLCSEDSQNAECPVCSSDFALCKAKGEQSEPEADADPPKTQQDDTEASKAKPTLLEAEDEGLLPTAEEVKNPAAKIIDKQAYATLAEAIEAAQDGDTIILQRDLTESVTIENKQNLTLNLNGKILTGKEESAPVIAVNGSNNLTVIGGTITGGTNGGTNGGIRIKNDYNTVVRLVDVTVSDNYTANCGGGIYLEGPEAEPTESEQFPVLVLTGSTTISGNTADLDGGGIYAKHARVNLNGGTVESNRSGHDGGGVYVENGFLQLFQATVKKNQGSENGGGIAVKNCGFDIATSEIYENEVKNGGGVAILGSDTKSNSRAVQAGTNIHDNTAYSNGGGIYAQDAEFQLNSLTIEKNSADNDGGGGVMALRCKLTAIYATLSKNTCNQEGGGIAAFWTDLSIKRSEFLGNRSNYGGAIYLRNQPGPEAPKDDSAPLPECLISEKTTMSGNKAYKGGALFAGTKTKATFDDCSLTSNVSSSGGWGGGICAQSADTITLKHTSVSGNKAQSTRNTKSQGGGIYVTTAADYKSQLILTDGSVIEKNEAGNGGGIYITGNSSVTVNGGQISDNQATGTNRSASGGGGIFAENGPTVTLSGATLSGNQVTGDYGCGGGVHVDGGTLTVNNSKILNNATKSSGGGIFVKNSALSVADSEITGNNGGQSGGGIKIVDSNSDSAHEIIKTHITDNSAIQYGAGIRVETALLTLTDSELSGNTATASGSEGGGLSVMGSTDLMLSGNTITGNSARDGGGIWVRSDIDTVVTIKNTQITGNNNIDGTSVYAGGGVMIRQENGKKADVTIEDSKIDGNRSANGGGIYLLNAVDLKLKNSSVSGNNATSVGGGIFAQDGTQLHTDKLTVSGNTAAHGGGLYLWNTGSAPIQAELLNSFIDSNKATGWGGGIFTNNRVTLTLNNTSISENEASTAGGLLLWKGSSAVLTNGKICSNTAKNGGGVYATENSTLRMGSGSISGNTATNNGGGIYADSTSTSQLTGGDVYNNHAGTAGDDLYLLGTANGTTILRAVDTNWVLDDCSHNIDGWYLDGKDARWNADAANAETYYVTNLEKQVDGTAIVKNADGTYTLTSPIALKAAHGLYGYTVRYLEKDTNKVLHEAKRVENQPLGTEVTESAVDISGYDQVAPTQVSITISADSEKNVITFYYTLHRSSGGSTSTPEPEQKPDPTPTPTPVPPVVVPSTPAPTTTPVRRITPAAQPTPAPTAAPTAQPADSQPAKAESEPEVIEDEETPLAPMGGGAWALVNLILMLLTVLASLLLLLGYLGKKKYAKEDEYGNALHDANGNEIIDYTRNKKGFWRVASLIPAIAAVIAFVLTENMRLPMIMVDRWTLLMVIIAVVQLIVAVLCKKKKESEEDEDEANI